jgi:hypothetical protein
MEYQDIFKALYNEDYQRVERDDRILDVFSSQTREKGIELWEKWSDFEVRILRIKEPLSDKNVQLFIIARGQLESLLKNYQTARLDDFALIAAGDSSLTEL